MQNPWWIKIRIRDNHSVSATVKLLNSFFQNTICWCLPQSCAEEDWSAEASSPPGQMHLQRPAPRAQRRRCLNIRRTVLTIFRRQLFSSLHYVAPWCHPSTQPRPKPSSSHPHPLPQPPLLPLDPPTHTTYLLFSVWTCFKCAPNGSKNKKCIL